MSTKLVLSKPERHRLFAVIIPVFSGKTKVVGQLANYRNAEHTEIQFIDVDEFALSIDGITDIVKDESTKELKLFPRLRDEIFQIVKDHPDTKIVVVTSNNRFVKFLEIKPKRTSVFASSLHLFSLCVAKVTEASEMYKIQSSREEILKLFAPVLKYYNTFEELELLFVKIYDLVRKS